MATSGECEVYAEITDFSSTTGEVSHYMKAVLYSVPQKDAFNKLLCDDQITSTFVDGRASINIIRGAHIRVEIPTVGYSKSFIVPDQASYNIADLVT